MRPIPFRDPNEQTGSAASVEVAVPVTAVAAPAADTAVSTSTPAQVAAPAAVVAPAPITAPVVEPAKTGRDGIAGFDISKWDGDIEKLPDESKELVRMLWAKKETEATTAWAAKETEYSAKVKAAEDKAAGIDTAKAAFDREKETLLGEIEIYKALAEGSEDPRVGQYSEKIRGLEAKYTELETKYNAIEKAAEEKWARDFRSQNAAIFKDPIKAAKLYGYMDDGFDPDAAVLALAEKDDVIKEAAAIIKQMKLPPESHKDAIALARVRLNANAPERKPRVAATVTAGADTANTPARAERSPIAGMPMNSARSAAAAAAIKATEGRP